MNGLDRLAELVGQIIGQKAITVTPFIVINGERLEPDAIVVNEQVANTHVQLGYGDIIAEDIYINKNSDALTWQRKIYNISGGELEIDETGVEISGISFGGTSDDDYFYHVENPRIYNMFAIPIKLNRNQEKLQDSGYDSLGGNRWSDPGVASERIGASPYQPFPAILLANFDSPKGLVHGTLSQRTFFHNYLTEIVDGKICLTILSSFKGIENIKVKPNCVLDDLWYLGTTDQADKIEAIFDNYKQVLRQHLPPLYGATDINRHTVVWGSWNDGNFRDIDHDSLIKTAEFISNNLPTVKWMQIDDGYAEYSTKLNTAHGLGAPYEANSGVDLNKFPQGLKKFTDDVRSFGIKPAVWIGGRVPNKAPLVLEHPEWFIDYSYRMKEQSVLDVSKPEVREYIKKALDFFFNECGFEGMKHDFWSYVFEDSHPLLANNEHSGYQWRDWWLSEVRKRLPDDGYLQTGCDIVMANPFLGEFFTNYRYGIDIGGGEWDYVKTNFLWGTACFALQIGDMFVPNSDSIGLLPGLSDVEAQLCINYCLISRSMVEVAGWLYKNPDHPRMKWVKKALCCPNNGQDVFFANFDYRTAGENAPEVWYLKTPHFALFSNDNLPQRTVAVFNLDEQTKEYCFTPADFGLDDNAEFYVTDVWTSATEIFKHEYRFTLEAHASRLLTINLKNGRPQLLDANIKLLSATERDNQLITEFAHKGEIELFFAERPENTGLENSPDFSIEQGNNNWIVSANIK
jgi:Melibiase/Alpha galactosidase C-terminal beta sandwich domain